MDHSERAGDLGEGGHSRKWWCSCDRNPSTCAAHTAAAPAPQWLMDGMQRGHDLAQSSEFPANNNSNGTRGVPFLPTNSDFIEDAEAEVAETSQSAGRILKGKILKHPLCDQILAAHIACLRIATPVDHLPSIDAQLLNTPHVIAKYSFLATQEDHSGELDQFMTHFALLLWSFKEHLQQHMRVHVMEAVMACSELEQSLLALTGVSAGEGTGETMTDEDEDVPDEETGGFFDLGPEGSDCGAYGPLIPTEAERSLMERVRQELKVTLKQGYKDRIVDVREEILRKRRAGKLPGNTTTVLKDWWDAHSKWPYPTEDEKARLVQETGLQLKQINNWFINQRKRNWHNNPSSSLRNKRKR